MTRPTRPTRPTNARDAGRPTAQDDEPDRSGPGPEPERLKIEGYDDWEDAVRDGLKKKPPAGGWPKPEKPKRVR
jgi:hypothetical protein